MEKTFYLPDIKVISCRSPMNKQEDISKFDLDLQKVKGRKQDQRDQIPQIYITKLDNNVELDGQKTVKGRNIMLSNNISCQQLSIKDVTLSNSQLQSYDIIKISFDSQQSDPFLPVIGNQIDQEDNSLRTNIRLRKVPQETQNGQVTSRKKLKNLTRELEGQTNATNLKTSIKGNFKQIVDRESQIASNIDSDRTINIKDKSNQQLSQKTNKKESKAQKEQIYDVLTAKIVSKEFKKVKGQMHAYDLWSSVQKRKVAKKLLNLCKNQASSSNKKICAKKSNFCYPENENRIKKLLEHFNKDIKESKVNK